MSDINPVAFFKGLADETRLKSLMLIVLEQELCVCELMSALGLSQPKVSRHLAQLRKEGILVDHKQAQWVFYRINPELPEWALQSIKQVTLENSSFIQQDLNNLQAIGDRPERQNQCC